MKFDRKKLDWYLKNIRTDSKGKELTDEELVDKLATWMERNPGCVDIHEVSDQGRFYYSTVGYGVFSLMGEKYRMGRVEIFDSQNESDYAVDEGIYTMPFISAKDDVQLRIYFDTAANNMVATTGAVGTMSSTLNSCQLLVSLSRLGAQTVAGIRQELARKPLDYQFTELRIGTYTVAAGSTNTSIILSSLVGPVSFLYFVVRPSGAVGDNYFKYTEIKDFAILDSGSTNIVGGQAIPSSLALTLYNRDWLSSSFTAETPSNFVYIYSFGASPSQTMWTGKMFQHHNFIGSEQLQINFKSALTSSVQVDIYAQVNAYIKTSATDVKKISINSL